MLGMSSIKENPAVSPQLISIFAHDQGDEQHLESAESAESAVNRLEEWGRFLGLDF